MTWFVLFSNVLALVVGFIIGLVVQWRQQELKGKIRLVPTFVFTAKRIDLLLAVGVVATLLGTVMYGAYNAERERECNLSLREQIEVRAYSSEGMRQANTDLIDSLIVKGPTTPEERAAAIGKYQATQDDIDRYIAEHPVPPAVRGCGI